MHTRRPHAALRPYVASMVGYREAVDPRAVHHGLPSPTVTVVLAFDEPLDVGWLADPASSGRFWTCASGLHAAPARITTHGWQHGVQLALTPLGSRVLLGLPAGALGGALASHDDLPLGVPADLHSALATAVGWEARFDLLEGHLLALVGRGAGDVHRVRPEVAEAWRLTVAGRGTLRVAALAERVGWSRRRLLSGFRSELGVTPKEAARITRFDHARRLVAGGADLAEAAHDGGYADQAHLSREWSALAGRTPTQLRASAYHVEHPDG
ncbi:helix-turn-helix domain-containing protein [Nocardioides sp. GXQ0305]|uniref:AraC family transcriptional regulator n=1 Tax=Nocardioides sp. GXQ0305 TaxID=3423912 RepID=UPI003D7DC9D4